MSVTEWDHRELCPDGACVGLIGPDGTCKVCGRVAQGWGDERKRGLARADSADGTTEDTPDDPIAPAAPARLGDGWTGRDLCPDGACIGVIGEDGRCRVCGRAGERSPELGELAAAASELAGVASATEVAAAKDLASAADAGEDEVSDDDRKLCPDGGCVGLIGTDGRCKVCGKEAA